MDKENTAAISRILKHIQIKDENEPWRNSYLPRRLHSILVDYIIVHPLERIPNTLKEWITYLPNEYNYFVWTGIIMRVYGQFKKFVERDHCDFIIFVVHLENELRASQKLDDCVVCMNSCSTKTICGHMLCWCCFHLLDKCPYCRRIFERTISREILNDIKSGCVVNFIFIG